ncbi:hypothetical protein ACFVH6_32625 [Spirillospora sp. NPDC127200]
MSDGLVYVDLAGRPCDGGTLLVEWAALAGARSAFGFVPEDGSSCRPSAPPNLPLRPDRVPEDGGRTRTSDPRDHHPELPAWAAEDRRDVERLGQIVVEFVRTWQRHRSGGPTWWMIAAHVRPEGETLPETATRPKPLARSA